jgi:hypothetical protein
VREALRNGGPRAIQRLLELVEDTDGQIAIKAAELVAKRVYGHQTLGLEIPDDPAQRLAMVEAALLTKGVAGDTRAMELWLRANAPDRYGNLEVQDERGVEVTFTLDRGDG